MKIVLYSQRVEIKESYHERWDCADQKIAELLVNCGYLPVPVPNSPDIAYQYIMELQPAGIVLTGGNNIQKYGGNAPERDQTDCILIKTALENDIPLYGFCRGMQSILDYFGNALENVEGHVAVRHRISGMMAQDVNSYHTQAARTVKLPLEPLAISKDGVIEAIIYPEKHVVATMWHPEREQPFNQTDKNRIQGLFG